ncbi:MAG: sulfatase-like hydrolase/transferase, partial [Desulfobacteraceae bacterium]|nr:sulfatase-like hydrolase/transferase [Desulfobacteraceae bacterium]
MTITRREFIKRTGQVSAAAMLGGVFGCDEDKRDGNSGGATTHPNILLLMVDQQQMPPAGYGKGEGMVQGLKEILGFRELSPNNRFTEFFPGYLRLRRNGVVLRTHYTASSACVPSRACIMTGSYTTGVTQTDGLFKSAEDVPWLDPDGTPTIGDWFRAVGYSSHYFGKWHVSDPPSPGSLEPWGFEDWEKSYPEPHGGGPGNLGVYRDVGFADTVVEFLKDKALESSDKPWFAVGSLVNPHDNGAWPINWQLPSVPANPGQHGVVPWEDYPPPPPIPVPGEQSLEGVLPDGDTLVVPLNPDGFPQNVCSLPRTFKENLETKPRCQYDYSLKFGLCYKSIQEYNFQQQGADITSALPYQLQGEWANAWSLGYNQRYAYCQYLADLCCRKCKNDPPRKLKSDPPSIILADREGRHDWKGRVYGSQNPEQARK